MKFWKILLSILTVLVSWTLLAFTVGQEQVDASDLLSKVRNGKNLSKKEKEILLDKAISIIEKTNPNDLPDVSFTALRSGDSLLFRKYSKIVLQKAQESKLDFVEGMINWDLGDFLRTSKPDSAFYHYQKANKVLSAIALPKEDNHLPSSLLLSIASLKDGVKDYGGAEKDVIAAIAQLKKINRSDQLFRAYNQLGIIQNGLNKPEKALEYHTRAKTYIKDAPKNRRTGHYLSNANNLASVYLRKKEYETAFGRYNGLKNQPELKNNPQFFAKVITSRVYSGYNGRYLGLQEFQSAFIESNRILDSIGYKYGKARNYEYYAQVLVAEKDTVNAVAQAQIAANLAKETMNNDRLLSSLKLLVTIDNKNSAKHAQRFFTLNEDLQQKERDARIRLETDEIIEENEGLIKDRKLLAWIALVLLILGVSVIIMISQKVNNQRLKFKQKQQEKNQEIYSLMLSQHGKLEEGKKTEQKRISEELHDGILGQLLGLRLFFSGLNERSDPDAITQREELLEKMRDVEEEIRTISHELNEAAYEKVDNFIISIQQLVLEISNAAGLPISFFFDENFSWNSLDGDLKINIYRIVQECLQNCVKHAKCKNIEVNFVAAKKVLNLSIKDDGIGFDSAKGRKGIGLRNIISRTQKIEGTLDINSIPKQGTLVHIQIPIAAPVTKATLPKPKTGPPETV